MYTRGVEANGDMWDMLAELQGDKAAAQQGILAKKLDSGGIAGDSGTQLRRELRSIMERWESDRTEGAYQKKRPLLNSYEWGGDRNRIRR